MSNFDLVIRLFLQLTVILATCRIVTILGRRYLGQTQDLRIDRSLAMCIQAHLLFKMFQNEVTSHLKR